MGSHRSMVVLGRVIGAHALRGWIRLRSFTREPEAIFGYPLWRLGQGADWKPVRLAEGRRHGAHLVAKLEGVDDRTAAEALAGLEIAVEREALPPAGEGEYYWVDLEGLAVSTIDGTELGRVARLLETGANDVLVVHGERERLIPYVDGVVREVDLEVGRIRVAWDPED